jgi:imidazolonepropionase-like amidohydrolase
MGRWLTYAALLVGFAGCGEHQFVTRSPAADGAVVIRDVRVFDARLGVVSDGRHDVVLRDGRIAAVNPAGTPVPAAREVAGRGGMLLPGLIDVHTHTGTGASPPWQRALPKTGENLTAWLYAGVTTVLDCGALSPAIFGTRAEIRSGARLGPTMYAAGPIFTSPNGHPAGLMRQNMPGLLAWYVVSRAIREVGTPAEAEAAVKALVALQPDVIKVTIDREDPPVLGVDVATAIVAAGHAAGIRSVVHVGNSADVLDAVQSGADAVLHAPYTEEISDGAVAALVKAGLPVAPTVGVFDAIGGLGSAREFLAIERAIAPPGLFEALGAIPSDARWEASRKLLPPIAAAVGLRRRTVAKLRAAGVPILVGSDAANPGVLPGAGLHVELAALVESGMTPAEALRAATWENARFLAGEAADFGEIAVGKRADLLLVAGDPTREIGDLQRITTVYLGGVALARHERPNP